jgi:hypothetical protein
MLTVKSKRPKYVDGKWTHNVPVACGRCPLCRKVKLAQWCFRLQQEDKYSISSYFLTLTYNPANVPITKKGWMTLNKKHVKYFMDRLRKLEKDTWKEREDRCRMKTIKFYAVGEYGTKSDRPHYHIIIFNVINKENIYHAWKTKNKKGESVPRGSVHLGNVSGNSIAYTLKYCHKPSRFPKFKGDDRVKEFNVQSTKLGVGYLTKNMIKYHKSVLNRYYCINDGYKVRMPRYYANIIYTEEELRKISKIVYEHKIKEKQDKQKKLERIYKGRMSMEEYEFAEQYYRHRLFTKSQKNRQNV